MSKPRYWSGRVRDRDDFGSPITTVFFDAKTIHGPWAIMSPASFRKFGGTLGTGLGQQYTRQPDGRWLKTGG